MRLGDHVFTRRTRPSAWSGTAAQASLPVWNRPPPHYAPKNTR